MQAIVSVQLCMIGLPAGSRPQEFQTVQQQVRMHPMGPPGCKISSLDISTHCTCMPHLRSARCLPVVSFLEPHPQPMWL